MNICGILYVNETNTDGHIRRHFGRLAVMVLQSSLKVDDEGTMPHNGLDFEICLNIFEAVK